jgi:7,8-dihydropterin-6-yl-methyl-4-(beta-D-ribofuranosyl)aminobenzene 5'-phosphate synthase
MKITVLSDNRCVRADFETEHGLSVYVETKTHKYLLDTGASGIFISNAVKAGIDLSQVDYVFISHGHSDHAGGLTHFLNINSKAKIVLSKFALNQHYYSKRTGLREIGTYLDINKFRERIFFVEDGINLPDEVNLLKTDSVKFAQPLGNKTLYQIFDNCMVPDKFMHEIIITIQDDTLLVFTGCAHHGLLNMLDSVSKRLNKKTDIVIGGFHLLDSNENQQFESDEEILNLAFEILKLYPGTKFFTGHCTGEHAFQILKNSLKNKLKLFYAGFHFNTE